MGYGAWQWALKRGIPAARTQEELEMWNVTNAAQKQWRKYKEMIDCEQAAWKIPEDTNADLLQAPKKRQKTVAGMLWLAAFHKHLSSDT